MGHHEIIEQLARDRAVEQIVERITRRELDANTKDLCQIVYVVLLKYDPEKICDLHRNGEMNYFIARIVMNNLFSTTSRYYYDILKFYELTKGHEHSLNGTEGD